MAEWSIASVLKTEVLKGTGGSNPSLSASGIHVPLFLCPSFILPDTIRRPSFISPALYAGSPNLLTSSLSSTAA